KPVLVDHAQDRGALGLAQGVGRPGANGLGAAIRPDPAGLVLPALNGAGVDADHLAGRCQPGAFGTGLFDVADQCLAIFQRNHASASFRKIASAFFASTRSAAASASALSLRRSSRSSSRTRRRSALASDATAAPAGSASAPTAASRHSSSSLGNNPCARHQALRSSALIEAVVSTASNRAAAVQPPGFGPDARAAARQRSSVATDTPISRDTTARSALSGGN